MHFEERFTSEIGSEGNSFLQVGTIKIATTKIWLPHISWCEVPSPEILIRMHRLPEKKPNTLPQALLPQG